MRIACVQTDVEFNQPLVNARRAVEKLYELKADGVDLVVFPEAYLTGYCVECLEDARSIALSNEGQLHEALKTMRDASEKLDMLCIVGFAEVDAEGTVYNTAALFEPKVEPRFYKKTHLPDLGLDKFVKRGEELPVFETRLGKIAILICFDLRAPEPTRVLALQGAELLVLPTNWPVGAEISADIIAIARAAENRIFVATCDRVGEENGFRFIGKSKIIAHTGKVLASAEDEEATLIADIEMSDARQKRIVGIPGKYETEVFASRNPHLYSSLSEDVKRT